MESVGRIQKVLAVIILVAVVFLVLQMRVDSVVYFSFNPILYTYSIITAAFLLSRYLFSLFYHPVPVKPDYEPGVTVVVPCFNEEKWIGETIRCLMEQEYPNEKLEIIIVDDHSTDCSREKIREAISRYESDEENECPKLKFLMQSENMGKREAMARGSTEASFDLLVFVDSDSMLEQDAIRHLVQPFQDEKIGGVTGRTDVANETFNALTRMQQVRYYIAFRVMKAAESCFDAVTCLSGPIACYRRELVEKHRDEWLQQKFLGFKATFGDDRALTNMILKESRTCYQDTAVCRTIVPDSYKVFCRQQMRWKRSWLRESFMAAKYIWRKEPFMSLFFYIGLIVPIAAPFIFLYNVCLVPLFYQVFPGTFLFGIFLMASMMSFAYLLLRKGKTFLYGFWFCLYYEVVLLWQMPVAWVTFWKSQWGTRMTKADLK